MRSRAMAKNTAPQWVQEHGRLHRLRLCTYLLRVYYKSVCNTMQVYKHVLVNLYNSHQLAQCAVRYIT